MKTGKSKRLLAFILCVCIGWTFCGCNIIEEQWEVVEKYRKETATTEAPGKEKTTTTEALPEQNVLADFMNYDADTLGERIAVPNGYKRVGAEEEKASKKSSKKTNKKAKKSDATTEEKTGNSERSTTEEETASTKTTGALSATTQAGAGTSTTEIGRTTGESATTNESTTEERKNTEGITYTIESFMRSLPVKKQDGKVLLYNGKEKENQESYAAIVNLPLDSKNLQQRASSVMRLYAEYYWMNKNYDNMKYHLNNGFEMDYGKWIDGYRITVNNNTASWYDYGSAGDNYETLLAYLEYYFCYSGMGSLLKESHEASISDISVGDYFIDEKKENAAIVVDVAEDEKGNRCFLLASGGSPGQDIEILKNPAHEDPWYYVSEIKDTFSTPEFDLKGNSCYHLTTAESPATASGDASGNASSATKNVTTEQK